MLKKILPACCCFNSKEASTDNTQQVYPGVSPSARRLQQRRASAPSLGEGSSNGGVRVDTGKKTTTVLPSPREEELTAAIASLEVERSLVVETQKLLHREQEHRKRVSEQLAVANKAAALVKVRDHQAQERLAEEKKQKRKVDEQLRTVNVLRLSELEGKEELEADRDRYRAIVQDMTSKRLLAGGTNIQASFPTLLELQADVRRVLTISVSEWIEDASPVLDPGFTVQHLLAQLFHACRDVVDSHHTGIKAFFLGGAAAGAAARECCDEAGVISMDEATESFMRQHMRRHYRTLFPVDGTPFQRACHGIISRLAATGGAVDTESRVRHLVASGLEVVVQEYLVVMVGALLQHPPVEFGRDCGEEAVFCSQIHADSIDGDDVAAGDRCIVVFPALMAKAGKDGLQPLNNTYVLPLPGA